MINDLLKLHAFLNDPKIKLVKNELKNIAQNYTFLHYNDNISENEKLCIIKNIKKIKSYNH